MRTAVYEITVDGQDISSTVDPLLLSLTTQLALKQPSGDAGSDNRGAAGSGDDGDDDEEPTST